MQLKLGSTTIVVLTDTAAVKELLDQRSASTADRPPSYMGELVTGGLNIALARYGKYINCFVMSRLHAFLIGKTWSILRKSLHTMLSPETSNKHIPIQAAETMQLLFDILQQPEVCMDYVDLAHS